jgi:hypothetical protein
MELSDFRIGLHFFTATGEWVCADVGTKTILAFNLDEDEHEDDCIIFDRFDFGGCSLTPMYD